MTIFYLFRTPQFPIIFVVGNKLVCASSKEEFQDRISMEKLEIDNYYYGADIKGEVWDLNTKEMYISPSSLHRKRWSKKSIIEIYNKSDNCKTIEIQYSEKSITSKLYKKIFLDIFNLIEQSLEKLTSSS